ncbi:hypothetical protein C2S51_009483 [Perilla frutescens var. frutescens]|nr:hypothetical protein C2S51_009483 [Perilla frutescens var. frutescens]
MEEGLIDSKKLTSVGPGNATGLDAAFEPGNMDLAMKLHYLRGIYYFGSEAFAGLTNFSVKEPLFNWLNQYPVPCGRFRRSESGRAYIKCNDCGVRLIQATCVKTVDEWMEMRNAALENLLCPNHVVGPQLQFSPLVYLQLTEFKCGGMAVGLSWAHVLGDAFSAAKFMNMLGRVVSGSKPELPINPAQSQMKPGTLPEVGKQSDPISVKRVDPVGDNWVYESPCKTETFSFYVTPTKLSHLRSKLAKDGGEFPPFEALTAVIWLSIARVRADSSSGAEVINICRKGSGNSSNSDLGNNQIVSVVRADFAVAEASPGELAVLVQNEVADERRRIEEVMERDGGLSDFIVYGTNLTFVNLEEAIFYDFECKGQKPVWVSYKVDGVGEKGTVLVLPGRMEGGEKSRGRLVAVMLPEEEVVGVKSELRREGLMA